MDGSICIVGCGGIGCLIAGFIHNGGGRVIGVVRRREHKIALSSGVLVEGLLEDKFPIAVRLRGELDEGSCDIVVVAVKAYDVQEALLEASRIASGPIYVASNGFPSIEGFDAGRIRWIVVDYGVTRYGDNRFVVAGEGRFILEGRDASGDLLGDLLVRGGANVLLVDNVEPYRWAKAAINAAINSITSVLGVRNGFLVDNPYAWRLAVKIVNEAERVAEALGISLPYTGVDYLRSVILKTRNNKSSMLQDVESCRRTEVEEILGRIISIGRSYGVGVETIESLYFLVKAREQMGALRCREGRK